MSGRASGQITVRVNAKVDQQVSVQMGEGVAIQS